MSVQQFGEGISPNYCMKAQGRFIMWRHKACS